MYQHDSRQGFYVIKSTTTILLVRCVYISFRANKSNMRCHAKTITFSMLMESTFNCHYCEDDDNYWKLETSCPLYINVKTYIIHINKNK
jgi:hypothetical protein